MLEDRTLKGACSHLESSNHVSIARGSLILGSEPGGGAHSCDSRRPVGLPVSEMSAFGIKRTSQDVGAFARFRGEAAIDGREASTGTANIKVQ
jgi:hypothetical protein